MQYNAAVKEEIEKLLQYRNDLAITIGRRNVYAPVIEKILEENGVPKELSAIPFLESKYNPDAVGSGTVGLWQFVAGTAQLHGLQVSEAVDERRDPHFSTQAAAAYFSELYDIFGDWELVLAAYNCGAYKVKQILKSHPSAGFWEIRHLLPSGTQHYVPRIIACIYVSKYYAEHNIEPYYYDVNLKYGEEIEVYTNGNISDIALSYNVDVEDLMRANPALMTRNIPDSVLPLRIKLPYYQSVQDWLLSATKPVPEPVIIPREMPLNVSKLDSIAVDIIKTPRKSTAHLFKDTSTKGPKQ
ncbi:MAG: lytic transglycosylase domain-containing protein [Sphingobacteriales bacterium]|nr:lytic transglycosylase domain-containing protein [Sphingobacteriales bacterium]